MNEPDLGPLPDMPRVQRYQLADGSYWNVYCNVPPELIPNRMFPFREYSAAIHASHEVMEKLEDGATYKGLVKSDRLEEEPSG